MCNEFYTVHIVPECLLLLLYAWNSHPVPRTNISCSLVAVRREFAFRIGFSSGKHWQLTPSPATVESYSKDLVTRLSACCEIADLLVSATRDWHRALVNLCRSDPHVYSPGGIVFACCATRSDASKGRVGKLEDKFMGPWPIIESLKSTLYTIEHCLAPVWKKKARLRSYTVPIRVDSF